MPYQIRRINEKTLVSKSLFNKVVDCRSATLLKIHSGSFVHLWVFPKHIQNSFFVDNLRVGAMKFGDHITCTKSRASHSRCSLKDLFLKTNQNLQKNTCAGVSFIKVASWRAKTLLKKTSPLAFDHGLFKNTYFVEHLRNTVTDYYILSDISISDIRPQIWNSRPRMLISDWGFQCGFED